MKKPELNTTPLKIDKLINRIDEGEIKIPAFQRGYVWKQNQVIELLESLTQQYPVGSILLWEASEKDKLKSTRNIAGYKIPDKPENWPVNYILDGQQRLSSIYAVFSGLVEQETGNDKYNPDLDIFEIYYDFSNKTFLPKSEVDHSSSSIVCLRNMIDPIKLIDEITRLNSDYQKDAKTLSSIFLNYEIPIIQIKNRTKQEVGVIFERINNTGTKLNTLDLMTAWTWTEDFHLLDEIDVLLEKLDNKGFGAFDSKLVLQIISGIIIGSTKTENILRLTGERVRENWANVEESIKSATDFLYTEIKCSNVEFLPFHQQFVALCRFYSKSKRVTSEQIDLLKQFFWRTSFSNRYSTGRTTAKMDHDIVFMDRVIDYDFTGIDKYSISTTQKELISAQFSKANPITRAFLLLSAQYEPRDLANGGMIDLGKSLSAFNRKQYHHVFPNAFLTKKGEPKNKRFSVVNFCFLPADSNKKISSKKPSDYFENIVPSDKKHEILRSNLLPDRMAIYQQDDFDGFIKERADLIIENIQSFAG